MDKLIASAPEEALIGLLNKYSITNEPFSLDLGTAAKDELQLLPGWNWLGEEVADHQVPLLTWRSRQSLIELKKIVTNNTVENLCLVRIGCLAAASEWPLSALIYRQLDICEFTCGSPIISVYSVLTPGRSVNIIARLTTGVLCSIEIKTQLPEGFALQENIELIGQRGAASDRVVDTQVSQQSVYTFTETGSNVYQDTDMELFGLPAPEIEQVRAAFGVFKSPGLKVEWTKQHAHLNRLVKAVHCSAEEIKRVTVL